MNVLPLNQYLIVPFIDVPIFFKQYNNCLYPYLSQTSEVPAVKEVWNGIVRFSKEDPSVLDHDTQAHIRKVKGGNYAYFGDRTLVELSMASSCDLVLASTDIFYFTYALGLPNHSPFEKIFSDE